MTDPYIGKVKKFLLTLNMCYLQDNALMAYQIAFDLYDSATQQFLGQVLQALKASAPIPFLGECNLL